MAQTYADPIATLTPPPMQVPGAAALPRPEDDINTRDYLLAEQLAQASSSTVPLLGIGKTLAKYVANKIATAKEDTERHKTPMDLARKLDEVTHKEWRDWLPETLHDYVKLKDSDVRALDILMATQVGVTNIDVFNDWQLFYACIAPFNDRRANFEWLDKPSYLECAWTCTVLRALRPNTEFGPGVIRFLCAVMLEDGLVFFPWTGGDGIALDDGETGKYVRGLTDCQALAKDMRKVWEAGVIKSADPAELPDVDEHDPHHVQLAKLMNGAAYIRANEGTT